MITIWNPAARKQDGTDPRVDALQKQVASLSRQFTLRTLGSDQSTLYRPTPALAYPNSLYVDQPILLGITWTSNSPSAGSVAWSKCELFYKGNIFTIAAGSTANGFITWTANASVFVGAASYSPAMGTFLIATNTGGTLDEAWNKLGASSVQEANLAFSIPRGYQLAAPLHLTVTPPATPGTSATFTLLNAAAEEGILICMRAVVIAAPTTGLGFNRTQLQMTVKTDGYASPTPITVMQSAVNGVASWHPDIEAMAFQSDSNTPNTANSYRTIQQGFSYRTSLLVTADFSHYNDGGSGLPGSPSFGIDIIRAVKVS